MKNIKKETFKEVLSSEQFDDATILIDTDDKLPDNITFKTIAILMIRVINRNKCYPHLFLEYELYDEKVCETIFYQKLV